jgi:small subunit ribosomal protein S7
MNILIEQKFLIHKYIKLGLKHGNKEKNQFIFKLAFSLIKNLKRSNPIYIFLLCLEKALPYCEIKSINIKGGIQKVPIEIKHEKQKCLALNWLLLNTFTRDDKTMVERLAKEILQTVLLQSQTIKMCDDLHKTVEINKTFTQFKN